MAQKKKTSKKKAEYVPTPAPILPKGESMLQKSKRVMEVGFKTTLEKSGKALSGGLVGQAYNTLKNSKKKRFPNPKKKN